MVRSQFQKLFWNQGCDVVYNLPVDFDISHFCVFHSALLNMDLVKIFFISNSPALLIYLSSYFYSEWTISFRKDGCGRKAVVVKTWSVGFLFFQFLLPGNSFFVFEYSCQISWKYAFLIRSVVVKFCSVNLNQVISSGYYPQCFVLLWKIPHFCPIIMTIATGTCFSLF